MSPFPRSPPVGVLQARVGLRPVCQVYRGAAAAALASLQQEEVSVPAEDMYVGSAMEANGHSLSLSPPLSPVAKGKPVPVDK